MAKKTIGTEIAKFQYFYPYTVALVGAKAEERTNFMSCAWHTALSFDPPLFGVLIAKKRFTHQVITKAKEFTVNFIRSDQALLSAQYGRKSGFDLVKTEKFPVKLIPSRIIQSPVIGDAYISFECRLIEIRTYGDHDLFVGEVLAIHEEENNFNEQGVLDPQKTLPLLYLGSDFYCTVDPNSLAHVLPD
ncbi:MAG: flavin reductase [Candidatus Aminicenantes bacterium]|nr:MAG: flavin reductase [Candidatus Aminicenantes bacterium]